MHKNPRQISSDSMLHDMAGSITAYIFAVDNNAIHKSQCTLFQITNCAMNADIKHVQKIRIPNQTAANIRKIICNQSSTFINMFCKKIGEVTTWNQVTIQCYKIFCAVENMGLFIT